MQWLSLLTEDLLRQNLEMIQSILDPKQHKHKAREFIQELSKEIYQKIDDFVSNMQILLSEENLTTSDSGDFNAENTKRNFRDCLQKKEEETNALGITAAEEL